MKTREASITWERASFLYDLHQNLIPTFSATKDMRYRPFWYSKALLRGDDTPKIFKARLRPTTQRGKAQEQRMRQTLSSLSDVAFGQRLRAANYNFAVVVDSFFLIKEATMAFYRLELCSLFVIILSEISFAYFVTIDAHAEECFHDQVTSGTKMGLIFEVAEGGFLDIDVTVKKKLNGKPKT